MEIIDISIYKGRNIYSHKPAIKMLVDIGEYYDRPTKDIEGFNEKLLKSFPNLKYNCCSLGYEGGFLERLNEGTYLAHVLEHVILDIQNTLGYDVKYGKTRIFKEPSLYHVIFQQENEMCALECCKVAVFVLNYFLKQTDLDINEFIDYLQKVRLDTSLGPSTAAIVDEAKKRNIPITRIGYESLVRLGYGKFSKLIQSTLSDETSCISADISCNKQLTKLILDDHNIPVPYGKVVYTDISAVMAAKEIGMPVVVKPFNGNQGKGVRINLTTEEQVKKAFFEACKYSSGIIIEKFVHGNDYRVLVVDGKVRAVAQRLPAMVTGDGAHTIKELVDIVNDDPLRGDEHEKALTRIQLSEAELSVLESKGLTVDYIPAKGEKVTLRENGNISTGGTAIDCTDIIHPDNAEIAVNAANAIGIDIAGIDMVAEDISKSIHYSIGAVIEVNTAPGIRMHLYPSAGKPQNVAKDIVDFLFPEGKEQGFPIVSVTGTNGKTTTVRLINHTLTLSGKTSGMTSTSGSFIGKKCICKGDNSGPRSAKALLANKQIDVAVLETARGGIIREGLGYDLADVGIITNITNDHLGIDGIKSIEDLAFVKSLVAEAVKDSGYTVLNAEDGMTPFVLKRVKTKVMLFYNRFENIKVNNISDYIQVYNDNGLIKIKDNSQVIPVASVKDIPITHNGLLDCNIFNSLAAVCALYSLKVPVACIAEGLKSFDYNPGRFDIIEKNGYKIMLDYAHNVSGYEEVIKLCKKLNAKRRIGIIGMPGDRPDDEIKHVGQICAQAFDMIYIKEDMDLRNRKKSEVAQILFEGVTSINFPKEKAVIVDTETEALKQAMENAAEGDFIAVLYEKLEPLVELIDN